MLSLPLMQLTQYNDVQYFCPFKKRKSEEDIKTHKFEEDTRMLPRWSQNLYELDWNSFKLEVFDVKFPSSFFLFQTLAMILSHPLSSRSSYGYKRKRLELYLRTIAKVRVSTFNYKTGEHRPFNYRNRVNLTLGVVLKVVCI